MDNYTGPYWSNGKLQTSVVFGDTPPLDFVDQQSRIHDSIYAMYDDQDIRAAADYNYYKSLEGVEGTKAEIARNAVLYGNFAWKSFKNLMPLGPLSVTPLGLAGLVYGGVKNFMLMNKYIGKFKDQQQTIKDFLSKDPYPEYQTLYSKNKPNLRTENIDFRQATPFSPSLSPIPERHPTMRSRDQELIYEQYRKENYDKTNGFTFGNENLVVPFDARDINLIRIKRTKRKKKKIKRIFSGVLYNIH